MGLKIIALLLNRRHGGSTKSLKMKRLRLTQRKKFNTKKKTKQQNKNIFVTMKIMGKICIFYQLGKNMHFFVPFWSYLSYLSPRRSSSLGLFLSAVLTVSKKASRPNGSFSSFSNWTGPDLPETPLSAPLNSLSGTNLFDDLDKSFH